MNLTSALKLQAAKDFPTRKYDYFIDDNHWNQFGIHVAAAAISKYLTNRHVPRALSLLAPPKGLQPAGWTRPTLSDHPIPRILRAFRPSRNSRFLYIFSLYRGCRVVFVWHCLLESIRMGLFEWAGLWKSTDSNAVVEAEKEMNKRSYQDLACPLLDKCSRTRRYATDTFDMSRSVPSLASYTGN